MVKLKRMGTFTRLFFLPVFLSAAAPFPALGEPLKAVSLEEAIGLAETHHPLLQASRQDVVAAREEIREARSALFPKLELSETYLSTNNPVLSFGTLLNQSRFTAADFDLENLNDPDAVGNFRFGLLLTQPIYNGGANRLGLRIAHTSERMAKTGLEAARNGVVYRVIEAFHGVLLAREKQGVTIEAERISEENLDQIRNRFREGVVVKSDLLAAEVHLAGIREERIRAENDLHLARLKLKNAVGWPEPLDADGRMIPGRPPLMDPGPLLKEARESRPDYHVLREDLERAGDRIRLARSAFHPSLELQSAYERNNRSLYGSGPASYTVLGMLRLNLFNGMADQARLAQARAQRLKVRALLYEKTDRIDLEVREANIKMKEAWERIRVHKETIAQAEENLRIVRNRYETGVTTLLDLHSAEHLLTQARMNRVLSIYDYRMAEARLDLAVGRIGKNPASEEAR